MARLSGCPALSWVSRGVLRRARRTDNARIHDAAASDHQILLSQVLVDLLKYLLTALARLEKSAEVENSGLIGNPIRQSQARKAPHALDLVERVFHAWIRKVVEQLHAMNAEHHLQRIRRTADSTLVIRPLQLLDQAVPGNQ